MSSTNMVIQDLKDKGQAMISLFDSLKKDHQIEGLDIFQSVVNHVINRITDGRVACVKFVPVEVSDESKENLDDSAGNNKGIEIKAEPEDESASDDLFVNNDGDIVVTPPVSTSSPKAKRQTRKPLSRKQARKVEENKSKQVKIIRTQEKVFTLTAKKKKTDIVDPNADSKISVYDARGRIGKLPLTEQDNKASLNDEQSGRGQPEAYPTSDVAEEGEDSIDEPKEFKDEESDEIDQLMEDDDPDELVIEDDENDSDFDPAIELQAERGQWKSPRKKRKGNQLAEKNSRPSPATSPSSPKLLDNLEVTDHPRAHLVNALKCRHCKFVAENADEMDGHMEVHKGLRRYECGKCGKLFTANSSLKRHLMAHDGIKPHECTLCQKSFVDGPSLRTHMVVHTGERSYQCDQCEKKFTNSANLSRHKRVHTGEMPYQCKYCGTRFRDLSSLKLHVLKHTGEKPYECEVCGKQFKTSSDLLRHSRTHTGERKYACKRCGKTFIQGWHLKQHEKMHLDIRPYQCSLCKKRLRSKSSLQAHMRSHEGIKLYECDICQKKYSTKKYLQNHQVLHTNAKPYKCKTCGSSFNQLSNLKRHERIHIEVYRYECTYCSKKFKYINSWRYHEGIHKNERQPCKKCGLSFRSEQQQEGHHCDPSNYEENLKISQALVQAATPVERLGKSSSSPSKTQTQAKQKIIAKLPAIAPAPALKPSPGTPRVQLVNKDNSALPIRIVNVTSLPKGTTIPQIVTLNTINGATLNGSAIGTATINNASIGTTNLDASNPVVRQLLNNSIKSVKPPATPIVIKPEPEDLSYDGVPAVRVVDDEEEDDGNVTLKIEKDKAGETRVVIKSA